MERNGFFPPAAQKGSEIGCAKRRLWGVVAAMPRNHRFLAL